MTVTIKEYTSKEPPPVRPLMGFRIRHTGWCVELWKSGAHEYAQVESTSFFACLKVIWAFWRKKPPTSTKNKGESNG